MRIYYFIAGAALVLVALLFICNNRKPQVLEVKTRIDTVSVRIVVHDTVTVEKIRNQIVVKSVPVVQYERIRDTLKEINDTENCYSVNETMKDGAYIKAEICSRVFPKIKPLDLSGKIEYLPAPDTVRTIKIVDSVIMKKPQLWKDIKLCGISLGIGITAGAIGMFLLGR